MKFTLIPLVDNPNPNMETTLHFEKVATALGNYAAMAFNRNHECVGVLAINNKLCADGTVPITQEMIDKMPDAWDALISGYHDVQLSTATRIYIAEFDIPDDVHEDTTPVTTATVATTATTATHEWMISHNGGPAISLEDMPVREFKLLMEYLDSILKF